MDAVNEHLSWPAGESEMAARIREHDWAATPLGPTKGWPQSLRTVVDLVLAMASPATIVWGPQHVQIYNDAYAAIARERHPGLLGRPASDNWPEAYQTLILPMLKEVRAGRATRLTELCFPMEGPEGQIEKRLFDHEWSAIRDETGAIAGALQTVQDVTERFNAQAAMRESEERLRNVLDGMDEGFGLMDRELRIITQNKAALAMDGRPLEEIQGRKHSEVYPETDPQVIALYDRAFVEGKPVSIEHRYGWHNGRASWLEMRAFPVPAGIAVFWRDISERKRAEQELRDSEELFRAMAEQAEVGVAMVEREGKLIWANDRLAELFGLNRDSLLQLKIRDITHPDDWPDNERLFRRMIDDGTPFVIEKRIDCAGKGHRWDRLSVSPRRDAAERIIGGIAVVVDITDRKQAEATLRESEERQAFLLALGDAVRDQPSSQAVIEVAARMLGERLGASRVMLAEFDETKGIADIFHGWFANEAAPFPQVMQLKDYEGPILDDLRAGRTVRVDDAGVPPFDRPDLAAISKVGVKALLSIPRLVAGRLAVNLSVHQHVARRWTDGEVELVREVTERLWADLLRVRAVVALREREALLRGFGEASSNLLWIRDAETLRWTYLTPAFETIYGLPREEALIGNDLRRWAELIVPEDRANALEVIRRVREGEKVQFEYRIKRPSDGEIRWLRNTDFPIRNEHGRVVAIGGIGHDVTAEKEAASRMEVLFAELQHRTRNLIGVVRAMAERTVDGAADLASFLPLFRDRLGALSRINILLSKLDHGERVTFDEMLRTELEARGFPADGASKRVVLDGPSGVRLRSATVQTFALAIHELTTNAVKYGALSNGSGQLSVTWRLRKDEVGLDRLQVEWIESGVSDIPADDAAPKGGGYGRMLIEKALPYQLGATTTYELGPDGVRCTIDLPLR